MRPLPKELTSLEVLGLAIREELDAQARYRSIAGKIKNPSARERFFLLASEEQRHHRLLERKYQELFPDVPLHLPPAGEESRSEPDSVSEDMSLRDALELAIEEESESHRFYLQAAERIDDLTGRAMMKYLADMEYAHSMSLRSEYEMLLKYPNYFDDTPEPWMEERGLRKHEHEDVP